jgi:CheY-like chemotaxis protein
LNVDSPSSSDQSALGIGHNPSVETPNFRLPNPAPLFKGTSSAEEFSDTLTGVISPEGSEDGTAALLKLLHSTIQGRGQASASGRFNWERRRVLVCAAPDFREAIAQTLADSHYHVYVADDTMQALDRMREERMEIVILDNNFDAGEQGVAFVANEVSSLRPYERRRLIFVQMSTQVRTGDNHTAFVNNYNLAFNPADVQQLPRLLERTMRDLHELYKNFNSATSTPAF